MGLETYTKKRNFSRTREPRPQVARSSRRRFVVQEHHASRLHYDFRLEMGGVLKSWAVPKGPTLDPKQKRLAVQVEDHPVSYLLFEGEISEDNYGAGQVVVWDTGKYETVEESDPIKAYTSGKLSFVLSGEKLRGQFNLVRMKNRGSQWLLIKSHDKFAKEEWELEPILQVKPKTEPRTGPKAETRKSTRSEKPSVGTRRTGKKGETRTSASQRGRIVKARPKAKQIKSASKRMTHPGVTMSLTEFIQANELEGDIQLQLAEGMVTLTNLNKPYWPREGITKGDLLRYYAQIAPAILPFLQDRPLILKRYPNGIAAPFFFQHDIPNAPDFVRVQTVETAEERSIQYAVADNLAALLYLTNLGTIEEHPWHSRVQDIDHPDWVVFDLDPEKAEFDVVCQVAQALRQVLTRVGLRGYAKTSGSRGIHVLVPIEARYGYDKAAAFAQSIAGMVVDENPQSATVVRSLSRRKPVHVYVDHLQNAKGKTIAAPYSVRARAGAIVSAPLDWAEVVPGLHPQEFTLKAMPARLYEEGDLFKKVLAHRQSLDEALKMV